MAKMMDASSELDADRNLAQNITDINEKQSEILNDQRDDPDS